MATHSSLLAWRIPWTEELGGLQSRESQRVRQKWSDLAGMQAGWQYTALYSFPSLETVVCSFSGSNHCFLTCIQVSLWTGKVVWYCSLFKNFPEFVVIHTVKGFGIVNEEVDVFLELPCFLHVCYVVLNPRMHKQGHVLLVIQLCVRFKGNIVLDIVYTEVFSFYCHFPLILNSWYTFKH